MKKILVVLLTLFMLSIRCNAASHHFYLDEAIPGIYTVMDTTTKLASNYVKPVRKVETGEYVYCVSPGVAINPEGNYTKVTQNMWDKLNITKEKYEKIQIISYFGYMYQNHTDLKWYAVTQYLIWQEVLPSGWSVYFTEILAGPKTTAFDSMINELKSLVNDYYKRPNFKTVLKGNYKNYRTIEDSYKVLSNYISSSSKVTINGNKLTLAPSNDDYSFTLKYNTTNQKSYLYTYNNAQWVVSRGAPPAKSYVFEVDVPKGNLIINKTIDYSDLEYIPSDIKASNIRFILYNDYYNEEFVTNDDGQIVINNLNIDKYYLKELDSSIYLEPNEEIYEINITKDNTVTKNIVNQVIVNNITIDKKYEDIDTLEEKPEGNATFCLYDSNEEEILRKTTNEEGIVNFKVPIGNYFLKQLSGLNNYDLIDTQEIVFTNKHDLNLSFLNKPIIVPVAEDPINEDPITEEPIVEEPIIKKNQLIQKKK